jgi:transposase
MSFDETIMPPQFKPKKFTYFIGIDVSRNKLDYAVMHDKKLLFHEEGQNEPEDILAFVIKLKALPGFTKTRAVFCMEQTGLYCNHLLYSLKKLKANVVLENPLQIKNSLGLIRDKNDKIDAIRIAQYAQKNKDELKLWVQRRSIILQLMNLTSLRNRLLGLSLALKTAAGEQAVFVIKDLRNQTIKLCQKSTDAISSDLIDIDTNIDVLMNSDTRLKELRELITSVPGVGPITAIQIIISTNEFIDIKDPKKFACYAGVAPFKKESGLAKSKAHVSPIANKKMKSLLHICAVRAIRCDPELKIYFERKTILEGKPKMLVLNAVRAKLILRAFACVNQNRHFEKFYVRKNELMIDNLSTIESDRSIIT